MKTSYLLDDYDDIDLENSENLDEASCFRPKFHYVFDEENPPVYRKVKVTNPDGTERIRHFDVAEAKFID